MFINDYIADFLQDEEQKAGCYLVYAKDFVFSSGKCSGAYIIINDEASKKKYGKITKNKKIDFVRSIIHG